MLDKGSLFSYGWADSAPILGGITAGLATQEPDCRNPSRSPDPKKKGSFDTRLNTRAGEAAAPRGSGPGGRAEGPGPS